MGLDPEILSVVPGKDLGGALTTQVFAASIPAAAKQILNTIFAFYLFHKSKNPLLISFGYQKQLLM